jgi:lysophospholipid acyltransferase (LPLAT)-like uncharacterized protein
MSTPPAQPTLFQKIAASAGAALLRILFATLRIRMHDPHNFRGNPPDQPVIYTFWHNRILAITAAFCREYPPGRGGVLVLTSASRDGMWLGEVAHQLGLGSVRGSSSRRGATAMRELLEKVALGHDIAITPDGPRGPKYELGAGLVYLAEKAGLPVLPVHANFSGCWRLRSWDQFMIPRPFSRVDITLGPLMRVPATQTDKEFEAERRKIESVLREGAA